MGHGAAALLISLGFLGGCGAALAVGAQLGLDPAGRLARILTLAVAALCLSRFVGASAALSRRRLGEGAAPRRLVDTLAVLAYLAIPVGLDAGLAQSGAAWPLPAPPHWLAAPLAAALLVGFAALAVECGVLAEPRRFRRGPLADRPRRG